MKIFLLENKFKIEFQSLFDLAKDLNIWLLAPIAMFLGYELTLIWFEFYRVKIYFCFKDLFNLAINFFKFSTF